MQWMASRVEEMEKTESQNAYAELDDAGYARLRRSLIRKSAKGSDVQGEFLDATRDTNRFIAYIRDALDIQDGVELEPLADRMSEAEFGNPPSDTERRMFDAWRELTPRIACRVAFWGRVTFRHIEQGRIESSFLAGNGGGTVTGAQRIDAALNAEGESSAKLMDACVRTVLRRLGGLPEVRGNRSVYVNCPLARAWWRERLVAEIAAGPGEGLERQIRAVVHPDSQQYWEDLVTFVVSRNSVFGSVEVRNILVRSLSRAFDENPGSSLRKATGLKQVCRAVSAVQASRELSVLPAEQVTRLMENIVQLHSGEA